MKDEMDFKDVLSNLFSNQKLAVLATQNDGQPYTNLVPFAATADLAHLLFATTRSTRKYANIRKESRASILVDNRKNEAADLHRAAAVTAVGAVSEPSAEELSGLIEIYLRKHPYLTEFVKSPSCAFLSLRVSTYYLVRKFQQVTEIHMPL